MAHGRQTQWTDGEILEALELRDHEGWTYARIAERLGRSRSALIGLLQRVDQAADVAGARGDGTMPRGWWRDGLTRRAA